MSASIDPSTAPSGTFLDKIFGHGKSNLSATRLSYLSEDKELVKAWGKTTLVCTGVAIGFMFAATAAPAVAVAATGAAVGASVAAIGSAYATAKNNRNLRKKTELVERIEAGNSDTAQPAQSNRKRVKQAFRFK